MYGEEKKTLHGKLGMVGYYVSLYIYNMVWMFNCYLQ
jgi:hypothetical protein